MGSPQEPVPASYDQRKRKIKTPKRDKVRFSCGPGLAERLARLENELVAAVTAADPAAADFLEWYEESARLYGEPVRAGLAVLYWRWIPAGERELTPDIYATHRDALADDIPSVVLDGEPHTGRTIVQELIWWSGGDWIVLTWLVEAIAEFRDYHARGGMAEWRRKRRRRIAAARRRLIKETALSLSRTALHVELDELDDPPAKAA